MNTIDYTHDHETVLRHVQWDKEEITLKEENQEGLPTFAELRLDVARGIGWLWNFKGLKRIVPPHVLANALALIEGYKQNRHQREPMPKHFAKILFQQAESVEDTGKPLKEGTAKPAKSD